MDKVQQVIFKSMKDLGSSISQNKFIEINEGFHQDDASFDSGGFCNVIFDGEFAFKTSNLNLEYLNMLDMKEEHIDNQVEEEFANIEKEFIICNELKRSKFFLKPLGHKPGVIKYRFYEDRKEDLDTADGFIDFIFKLYKAIKMLNKHKVKHCDIYSRNILWKKGEYLKLIDFGISQKEGLVGFSDRDEVTRESTRTKWEEINWVQFLDIVQDFTPIDLIRFDKVWSKICDTKIPVDSYFIYNIINKIRFEIRKNKIKTIEV